MIEPDRLSGGYTDQSRGGGLPLPPKHERGKTFSFVIGETTGFLTVAVATDGFTISVFGACTPMTGAK